jgi:hypothetical protein
MLTFGQRPVPSRGEFDPQKGKTITMLSIHKLKFLALAGATAALVACGGGSGGISTISGNQTGNITAANISVLLGKTVTFASGVPAFGTTSSTTLTFGGTDAAPTATITAGSSTATADVSFGSCIFKVKTSSMSHIPAGSTVTVNPCTVTFQTNGLRSDPNPQPIAFRIDFPGGHASGTTVLILNSNGQLLTGAGISVAGIVLTTGATGGGS